MHEASAADYASAIGLLEEAVELDHDYALAYAAMAGAARRQWLMGRSRRRRNFRRDRRRWPARPWRWTRRDAQVLSEAALVVALMDKDYGAGLEWVDTAARSNPSSSSAWGRSPSSAAGSASRDGDRAFRPRHAAVACGPAVIYQGGMGSAHMFMRDFPAAIGWLKKSLSNRPRFRVGAALPHRGSRAIGRVRRSARDGEAAPRRRSAFQPDALGAPHRLSRRAPRQMCLDGLRAAGLPE